METILLITVIIFQIITFYKLKQMEKRQMGAEQTVTDMIEQVITIVTEAFNTQTGDLTEAEAQAKKDDFIARITAIITPADPNA